MTILLVEQDVMTAFEIAQHAFVMETGRVGMRGHDGNARGESRNPPSLSRHVKKPLSQLGRQCRRRAGACYRSRDATRSKYPMPLWLRFPTSAKIAP